MRCVLVLVRKPLSLKEGLPWGMLNELLKEHTRVCKHTYTYKVVYCTLYVMFSSIFPACLQHTVKMIIDCNQEEMCSGLNRLRSVGELKIEVKYLKKMILCFSFCLPHLR